MAGEINLLAPHWQEVITHAVGFTAAVLVLRRYAWRPILGLIDERRGKIQSAFDSIDREKHTNDELRAEYQQQLRSIDAQARAKIQEAVTEGQKVASEIRDHARQEARDVMARARQEIETEHAKAEIALKEDLVGMAMSAAEKVIRSRLDEDMHRRLIEDAIDELTRMQVA